MNGSVIFNSIMSVCHLLIVAWCLYLVVADIDPHPLLPIVLFFEALYVSLDHLELAIKAKQ